MIGGPLRFVAQSAKEGSFWLPPRASSFAENTDHLFYFIYYLCLFFFVLIVAAMVIFMVKYKKKKDGEKTADIHGHTGLEIAWSAGPAVLLVLIFAWGVKDWMSLAVTPDHDYLDVRVAGRSWAWTFSYPTDGIESTELVVPVGRKVKLTMVSRDVLHSFFVPDFRIKRDVLPNRYTVQWFDTLEEGEHHIFCTEYCGQKHSAMVSKVIVKSEADFEKWKVEAGTGNLTPAQLGAKLFQTKACATCHSIDGQTVLVGPSLGKKYGIREHVLVDNVEQEISVDDNYIRESILDPMKKIVKGFAPAMPSFQGQLSDKEIEALIEYIREIK